MEVIRRVIIKGETESVAGVMFICGDCCDMHRLTSSVAGWKGQPVEKQVRVRN